MFGSEEMADWIQKAVGYSFTGITSEKATFLLIGPTDTGKSTFLGTICTVFEPYSQRILVESLMRISGHSNNIDADIADLRGVRFAITSETEENHRLSEARLKQISQGIGTIRGTKKYENPIDFPETHHLWISSAQILKAT
jgi:putative DNA primase/helicase